MIIKSPYRYLRTCRDPLSILNTLTLYTNINLYINRPIFSKLLLILSFIQCDKDLSFYIIIFYWFYVFKIIHSV